VIVKKSVLSSQHLLLALLAAIFVITGCGAATLQVKANVAHEGKRYDEALSLYQEILKDDPDNVSALKGIGETYLRMGKAPDAVKALEKAYHMNADRRTAINLGLAYSQAGDYGKAITTWDILIAREPDSNVSSLLKRHRTLALYRDAARHAQHAVAQERTLISGAAVAERDKAPAVSAPSAPPAEMDKKAKRPRIVRKGKGVKQDAPTAASPKPAARSAAQAKAGVQAPSPEKLERAFPVDANTLAVSPFGERGETEKTKYLRKALAAMIITDLSKAQGIQVVERVRVQKLLDELRLGQSGIVDPATSPRVGRLLGAGKIVSGNMLGAGDDSLHILRILTNVSTGKELGNQDAQGKVDEFFKMQKAIVFGILKDMGTPLAPRDEEDINRYATRSYQGLLLYGEGLDWQDMGEWDRAIKAFQQCVLIDPMGPCGPALAGSPSSGDTTAGPGDISSAAAQAAEADVSAAVAASAGGGGCFLPDTLVLTASGPRLIADIREGERLLTRNDQGEIVADTVARTMIFTNNHYFVLNGSIRVTGAHRFLTADGWIRAMDLKIGDRIHTNGETFVVILSKEALPGTVKVHNLEMTINHNFFVSPDGKTGCLVHNSK
jgi:tetratricopeptide (TPR) repeat protein